MIIMEVVDSEFSFLPSQAERDDKGAHEFYGQLIDLAIRGPLNVSAHCCLVFV